MHKGEKRDEFNEQLAVCRDHVSRTLPAVHWRLWSECGFGNEPYEGFFCGCDASVYKLGLFQSDRFATPRQAGATLIAHLDALKADLTTQGGGDGR